MDRLSSSLPVALALSALLAATVALIEPTKSAAANWGEIGIGFAELFAKLAAPFAVALAAFAALAALLLLIAPRSAQPLLLALYVSLWAQGSLFVWSYGSFDGSPIDWSALFWRGVLEIAFWCSTFALALMRRDWLRARALRIALLVFALQLAALAGEVQRGWPFPSSRGAQPPPSEAAEAADPAAVRAAHQYSSELNVIVIVLDSLQSDFFSDAIRDPELAASIPRGFTYYRNAVSQYARTEHSLQSILTSLAVPDNVLLDRWRAGQRAATLPARLAEQGFDTVLTSFAQASYRDFGMWGYRRVLASSLTEVRGAPDAWREDVSNLFALGLFRLAPHFAKPLIYDRGIWHTPRLYPTRLAPWDDPRIQYETRVDLATFDALIAGAVIEDATPRFRFLHFYGAHRPYTVDARCAYAGDEQIRRDKVVAVTHCMLSRVFAYLSKLDALGIYDRSLIFVLADHGEAWVRLDPAAAVPALPAPDAAGATAASGAAIDRFWQGVPLFLAKPLGDQQPFGISDESVALCDVPNSIFDEIALEREFGCESIFSARDPRPEPRLHYRYPSYPEWRALGLGPDEMTFEKFRVVGHSWRPESWQPLDTGAP